ncbi:MAG TPA: helix-turn-helix domain-containing protein [Candidatus Dormibacteraeota bacterium]|jgi:DNA-binding HxlR family transcriptional regulator|nr:helix-turn-helix domain-containing protein [Candidatus Dormibacteraeota bacterium]
MDEHTFCAVAEAIQLLQEKWTLHIIRALLPGPLGFNELGRAAGGCNPATLAQRLDRLESQGILTRTVESVMPPRTSYKLTCSGYELQEVIDAIDRWGRRNIPGPGAGARPALEHDEAAATAR